VSRTKDLVQEKMQSQRMGDANGLTSARRAKVKYDTKGMHKDISSIKTEIQHSFKSKKKAKCGDVQHTPIKVTKKQRNRRAAIIMGLKTPTKGSKK
jgi:hypothetical protein